MNLTEITFERLPEAMGYLIGRVESMERALQAKNEQSSNPIDRWMNVKELMEYLPDTPVRSTIYGWVCSRKIPYHKGSKKLRFLQSEIDAWLSGEKRKSETELEAAAYLSTKKGVRRYE